MKEILNMKFGFITPPGALVDDAAFVTGAVDCRGWNYLTIIVGFGAMDVAMAALSLQESNASNMASPTAVPNSDYAGSLPGATDDNHLFAFHVPLSGRKAYIDLQATGGNGSTGTYMQAMYILSEGEIAPDSAALRGFTAEKFCG